MAAQHSTATRANHDQPTAHGAQHSLQLSSESLQSQAIALAGTRSGGASRVAQQPQHNNALVVNLPTFDVAHNGSQQGNPLDRNTSCVSPSAGSPKSTSQRSMPSILDRSDRQGRRSSSLASIGSRSSIYDNISATSVSSMFSPGDSRRTSGESGGGGPRTPQKFLQHTPPDKPRTEGLPVGQAKRIQVNHQQHTLALAPVVASILVETINSHAKAVEGDQLPGMVQDEDDAPAPPPSSMNRARNNSLEDEDDEISPRSKKPKNFAVYETLGIEDANTLFIYVRYLMVESWCSSASFVGALVLIDRFLHKHGPAFKMSYLTAFKLFVVASRVAAKTIETVAIGSAMFAKAARVTVRSLNVIEERFLKDMEFDVCVLKDEWDDYAERILKVVPPAPPS